MNNSSIFSQASNFHNAEIETPAKNWIISKLDNDTNRILSNYKKDSASINNEESHNIFTQKQV